MSNLRFAVWEGTVHVARSEAHDWTHSLCNAHGGPTGETQFVTVPEWCPHRVFQPVCVACYARLSAEVAEGKQMLSLVDRPRQWVPAEVHP